jgi:hypothetical protein
MSSIPEARPPTEQNYTIEICRKGRKVCEAEAELHMAKSQTQYTYCVRILHLGHTHRPHHTHLDAVANHQQDEYPNGKALYTQVKEGGEVDGMRMAESKRTTHTHISMHANTHTHTHTHTY